VGWCTPTLTTKKTAEPGSKQSTTAELDWQQTKKKTAEPGPQSTLRTEPTAEHGSKQSTAAELDSQTTNETAEPGSKQSTTTEHDSPPKKTAEPGLQPTMTGARGPNLDRHTTLDAAVVRKGSGSPRQRWAPTSSRRSGRS
jgi:hypothetical protein